MCAPSFSFVCPSFPQRCLAGAGLMQKPLLKSADMKRVRDIRRAR